MERGVEINDEGLDVVRESDWGSRSVLEGRFLWRVCLWGCCGC